MKSFKRNRGQKTTILGTKDLKPKKQTHILNIDSIPHTYQIHCNTWIIQRIS